jgi:hypothetical protein
MFFSQEIKKSFSLIKVTTLRQIREIILRNYFLTIVDLRTQTHITVWSDYYFITKPLANLLPFGHTLPLVTFYQYIDYQLPNLVEQASNNLLYWSILETQHFIRETATQLTLFFNNTFLWHYYIPAKYQEIIQNLLNRHRIQFLS